MFRSRNTLLAWFCWRKRRSSTSSSSDSDDERNINKRIEEARRRDEERKWLEMERLRLAYVNYYLSSVKVLLCNFTVNHFGSRNTIHISLRNLSVADAVLRLYSSITVTSEYAQKYYVCGSVWKYGINVKQSHLAFPVSVTPSVFHNQKVKMGLQSFVETWLLDWWSE